MGSTGEGRSLGTGISIPQWMRAKSEKQGFDPSALSPPAHDDDFLMFRFPKANQQAETSSSNYKSLAEVLENKEQAFSKHTNPCKQFIPKIQDTVPVIKPKIIKPMGVDDGFKGEAAKCATSVVAVAHNMVAGSFTTDDQDRLAPPSTYLRHRRNSKSLPASPLASPNSSPRSRRKNNTAFALQNRFFTGPFMVDKALAEGEEVAERKSSSNWMLSGLLPALYRESAIGSSEMLDQAGSAEKNQEVEAAQVKLSVEIKTGLEREKERPSLLKPKPSELREMNFWSPTSM